MSKAPWRIIHKASTASTNLDARYGDAWDVFTADAQTAGRGRLDHKWLSRPGMNLMMSAVLPVAGLDPEDAATLPLAVGLAVVEALDQLASCPSRLAGSRATPSFRLKWPNDVLADGRKISGILCEMHGDSVVAGIGVNVLERDFQPEISESATSLSLLGVDVSVEAVRDAILASLAPVFEEWRLRGFASIWSRIIPIDCLKGRWVSVAQTDGDRHPAEGFCSGINADGSLDVNGSPVWAGEAHVLADWVFDRQNKQTTKGKGGSLT